VVRTAVVVLKDNFAGSLIVEERMPQQLNIESTMRAIRPQGSFNNCHGFIQEMGAAKKKGEAERGGKKRISKVSTGVSKKMGLASSTLDLPVVMVPGELDY